MIFFWESTSLAVGQEISRILWNINVYYPVYNTASNPEGSITFCNVLVSLKWGAFSLTNNAHLEDHLFPAVYECWFNILAATLHIWRLWPPSANWVCAMPLWQRTGISFYKNVIQHVLVFETHFIISCHITATPFLYYSNKSLSLTFVSWHSNSSRGGQIRFSGIQICLSFKVNSLRQYCG